MYLYHQTHRVAEELAALDEDPSVKLTDDRHSVAGLVTEALPLAVKDWFGYTKGITQGVSE